MSDNLHGEIFGTNKVWQSWYVHTKVRQKMKGNKRVRGNIRSGQHMIIVIKHSYKDINMEIRILNFKLHSPSDNLISYIVNEACYHWFIKVGDITAHQWETQTQAVLPQG